MLVFQFVKAFAKALLVFGGMWFFCMSVAMAERALVVYTYDSFTAEWGPGPAIEKAFEAQCDCDLQFVGLESSGAILSRLRLEGDNTQADIILGLDTNSVVAAKATGLLQAHGLRVEDLTLPIDWRDDFFLPFDYGYFAFIYDKRKVSSPPASLAELVENPHRLSIVFSDPRFSSAGLGLLLWVRQVYGDDAVSAWQALQPHIIAIPPSWSAAYGLFLEGEADLVLSYTTSAAYHLIAEETEHYVAANFAEGHYMQVEVAAMTRSAEADLARQFLRFMLRSEFQSLIPTGNWMYPVVGVDMPQRFIDLPRPERVLFFSPNEVAQSLPSWMEQWRSALRR